MNLVKMIRLYGAWRKAQAIGKEKGPMNGKITQITALLVSVCGIVGAAHFAQNWIGHNTMAYASIAALAQILHAVFPSIFTSVDTKASPDTTKKLGVLLLAVLLVPALHAQTGGSAAGQSLQPAASTTAAPLQNIYGAGISYSVGGSPAIAGTGLYAHSMNASGTYAFTVIDALPNTLKPFTVTTNAGVGIAQKVTTIRGVPLYVPTAAGISWTGTNTGWQWNGGVMASVHLKGNSYLMPSVRFLKSSVSGGTGYQPILGVLYAWGK